MGIEILKEDHGEALLELSRVKQQLKNVLEEHNHAILQLKKSEEKFKTVADYTYDWEYWLSPEGDILYNSPSCKELTGYSADEFFFAPDLFTSIVHPDDRHLFALHRQDSCYTSNSPNHIQFRIITKNGTLRWVAHSCQPVYNVEGHFLGRRASNKNITFQKHIEEQVRISEERLRLALDSSSDAVWDKNLISNEEYFGESWYRILGYTRHDVEKNALTWHKLLHPDDKLTFIAAVNQHLEGLTKRYEVEIRVRNKTNEWQWFLARGKVVEKSEAGQPVRIVGIHTDITKNKKNELELKNIKDSLEDKVVERTKESLEVNVALNVLLNKMEKGKVAFEREISDKIEKFINPYLEKLEQSELNVQQRIIIEMLTANLKELTDNCPSSELSVLMNNLTPTEFQVANLVKHGKTTKEIADLMHLSPGTISIHRKNIRKKLKISQKKINLQAFLASSL